MGYFMVRMDRMDRIALALTPAPAPANAGNGHGNGNSYGLGLGRYNPNEEGHHFQTQTQTGLGLDFGSRLRLQLQLQLRLRLRWLGSTNAKDIAILYLLVGLISGLLGTMMSYLMRIELSGLGTVYLDSATYNVVITMHGVLMIFYLLMPVFIGTFGNWLVPVYVGGPDMAFPRLNNISLWLLIGSLITAITSLFGGDMGADYISAIK
jgi:hypothetical protein